MSKLYEIASEYAELANSDMDAELIADTLEGIQGEFEDKAEQIIAIIKNEKALEGALKAEVKALSERAKVCANKQARLKKYLIESMQTMSKKSLNAGLHSLAVRRGVESVFFEDLEKIPSQYVEYETMIKPDKNQIKERLKLGEKIEGVTLVRGDDTLLIK